MAKSILIINEDEEEIKELQNFFAAEGSTVFCVKTVDDAIACFANNDLCLIILDADLSVEDDHRLLRVMRKSKNTPILVLSSQSEHRHRLETLKAGAHAYMGSPYSLEECLAQAQSLMQMYMESHPNEHKCFTLAFGKDLIIDPEKRKVFLKGKELHFTRKEFDLLFCLASSPGKVFTREQLYDCVWNEYTAYNVDDVVKAHIKALRQKLSEGEMEYIKNVWGVGYRFHHEQNK